MDKKFQIGEIVCYRVMWENCIIFAKIVKEIRPGRYAIQPLEGRSLTAHDADDLYHVSEVQKLVDEIINIGLNTNYDEDEDE